MNENITSHNDENSKPTDNTEASTTEQTLHEEKLSFWQKQVKNTNFKRAIIHGSVLGIALVISMVGYQALTHEARTRAMNLTADNLFVELQLKHSDKTVSAQDIENGFRARTGFTPFNIELQKTDECISVEVSHPVFNEAAIRSAGEGCFVEENSNDDSQSESTTHEMELMTYIDDKTLAAQTISVEVQSEGRTKAIYEDLKVSEDGIAEFTVQTSSTTADGEPFTPPSHKVVITTQTGEQKELTYSAEDFTAPTAENAAYTASKIITENGELKKTN